MIPRNHMRRRKDGIVATTLMKKISVAS